MGCAVFAAQCQICLFLEYQGSHPRWRNNPSPLISTWTITFFACLFAQNFQGAGRGQEAIYIPEREASWVIKMIAPANPTTSDPNSKFRLSPVLQTICKPEVPTTPSSGMNNLLEWLRELREPVFLLHSSLLQRMAQGIYSLSHFLIWHFLSSSTKSSKRPLNGKKKLLMNARKTVSQPVSQTTNTQKCDFIFNNIMNWRISNRTIKRKRKMYSKHLSKGFPPSD